MNIIPPKQSNLFNELTSFCWDLYIETLAEPSDTGDIMTKSSLSSFRCIDLQRKVTDSPNILHKKVQAAWDTFYQAFLVKDSKEIERSFVTLRKLVSVEASSETLKMDHANSFLAVDLHIVPDNTLDPLPLNAIRKNEMEACRKLYETFVKHFKFKSTKPIALVKQLRWMIQVLMSRPLGRELIRSIVERLEKHDSIEVHEDDDFTLFFDKESRTIQLSWSLSSVPDGYVKLKDGKVYSCPFNRQLILGHELIHLLHHLKGEASFGPNHPKPPNPKLTDKYEEFRTIDGGGLCPCHPYDPLNEQSLRAQFNAYERHGWLEGCSKNAQPDELLVEGMDNKADGDIAIAFHRGLSSPVVQAVVQFFHNKDLQSPVQFLNKMRENGVIPGKGPLASIPSPAGVTPEHRKPKPHHPIGSYMVRPSSNKRRREPGTSSSSSPSPLIKRKLDLGVSASSSSSNAGAFSPSPIPSLLDSLPSPIEEDPNNG